MEGRTFMQVISEKYSPENFPYRRGPGMGVVVPSGHQGSPMKGITNSDTDIFESCSALCYMSSVSAYYYKVWR